MKVQKRNEEILSRICNIKAEHPFWGYRRVWAYLKYRQNIIINHKRVYLLMKKHNLLVKPNTRLRAIRANAPHRSKPRATKPNQYWGIDMTKVMVSSFGWLYLVVVLDWHSNLPEQFRRAGWKRLIMQYLPDQVQAGITSSPMGYYQRTTICPLYQTTDLNQHHRSL